MITPEELDDENIDADIERSHDVAEFLLTRDARLIRAMGEDHEHTLYAMWLHLTHHLATLGWKPARLAEAALHHANMEQPKEEEEPTGAAPTIQ
jgi:hypothetical protein